MPSRAPRGALARLVALAGGIAIVAGACVGPLASPTPVPASSDAKTDTRSVQAFTSVTVDGALNVVLSAGSTQTVQVEAPSNVVALVRTDVSGTELSVTIAAPGFTSAKPATVRITSPKVTSVSFTGGASGTLEAMGQALAVSVSGGSTLKGIGTVAQLSVTALGNSTAELGDLSADAVAISAAGGAKVTLRAVKQLTGTADGGSVVTLAVTPVAQSVTVTGGAKVVGP
jgi:hypothetical protein